MKKILLVITTLTLLSALLLTAACGLEIARTDEGLITIRPKEDPKPDPGPAFDFVPPTVDLYQDAAPIDLTDILILSNGTLSEAEKAASLLVYASYNNINIHQFYYEAHSDMTSRDKLVISDYCRAKTGANMAYQSFAYTGVINPAIVRIDYVDQRLQKQTTATYNSNTKSWAASFNNPTVSDRDPVTLPELTPYNLFSWYDFPLDLGGVRSCLGENEDSRTEAIDASLIDEDSVRIELLETDTNDAYYRITFQADIAKARAFEETMARLSASFGDPDIVSLRKMYFTVEIWKDLGVLRRIEYSADVIAIVNGLPSETNIFSGTNFAYDDARANVVNVLMNFDSVYGGWISKLSTKNRELFWAEFDALQY